jgi:hypothetical protein
MRRRRQDTTTSGRAWSARLREPVALGDSGSARVRGPEGHVRGRPAARPLTILALISLCAAATAAVVRAVVPFDHGIWLVAYLFLVGFLAQILLAWGQDSLHRRAGRSPAGRTVRIEAVLWNLGVVAVPLGVLVNARVAVVIGSCVLLGALALFARSLSPSPRSHDVIPTAMAYSALLLGMVSSVAIGTGLAWDIPWI